ncbi:MAG: hypothetical protein RSA62_07745, partial [Oscillospiraceae bacterium]
PRGAWIEIQIDYNQQRIDNFKALDPNDENYEEFSKAQIGLIEAEFSALNELSGGREMLTGRLLEQYDAMEALLKIYYSENGALSDMETGIDGTASALDRLKGKMKDEEKGDTFKSYAEKYKVFLEKFNAGLVGSEKYQTALEEMLGPKVLEGLNYDWAEAGALLASDFWQGVFSEGGEDYGANFANALYEISDVNGDVIDENGRVVASFENVNGALDMEIESFDALAALLGTTPELLSSITDALGIYSGKLTVSAEEATTVLSKLKGVITEIPGNIKQVDMSALVSQMAELGYSNKQIIALSETIKSMDGFSPVKLPADIAATAQAARDAKSAAEGTKEAVDELGKTKAKPKIDVDTTAADAAGIKVKNLMTELDALSATPTITALVKLGFGKFAKGTKNAPAGPALVNEEAPEIIKRGDEAFIAGDGKPTVTELHAGDIVYNGDESKAILQGFKPRGLFGAFDGGANITGIPIRSDEGGNPPATLPAAIKATVSSKSDISKAAKESLDELKKQMDALFKDAEHRIELLSKQPGNASKIIAEYQKLMDFTKEQADKYRALGEDENSDYIQDLQKQWWGYYENIKSAQKELWDELDRAVQAELETAKEARDRELAALDLQKKELDEARDIESDRVSLEEKKLSLMEAQEKLISVSNERDVRMLKDGKWQWVADEKTVRDAGKALENAEKELQKFQADLAYQAAVDEINARKDAINTAYDTLEAGWKTINKSLEEPSRKISEILADIAENGTPEMKAQIENVGGLLAQFSNFIAAATGKKTGAS